jgi:hypothetical protein
LSRALPVVIAFLAIAMLEQPASAKASVSRSVRASAMTGTAFGPGIGVAQSSHGSQPSPGSAGSGSRSGTNATVACKRPHADHIRCTMTVKGGAGISGTVRMRLARGTLLVALGQGHVAHGKATLTMRVLHPMTPGRYTVKMVLTVNVTRVLRLR